MDDISLPIMHISTDGKCTLLHHAMVRSVFPIKCSPDAHRDGKLSCLIACKSIHAYLYTEFLKVVLSSSLNGQVLYIILPILSDCHSSVNDEPVAINSLYYIPNIYKVLSEHRLKDRQQLARHDSRYFTFLCSYSMYSIILYIKLWIIFFSI